MMYLVLSICISSILYVIFKYFGIYRINTLQAIVVNYVVAFVLGISSANAFNKLYTIAQQPWLFGAIFLGLLFVFVFFIMAKTSQKNGVSVASIAGKMSVVFPIVFGILLYKESVTFLKIIGIIIALIAVYLSSVKDKKHTIKTGLLLPVLLFVGSGVIDTSLKYIEKNFVPVDQVDFFSGSLFAFAATFGVFILIIRKVVVKERFEIKSIFAGIFLGIPNYYSIVFLIKALQNKNLESSTLFTINNVGTVVISTLLGLLIFKEKFSIKNKIGIILAVLGIMLVTLS